VDITPEAVAAGLKRARYITNERVETAIYLALAIDKPLLIEGPAGSGKTEVAKVIAEMLETELVRLQCYEGLDEARALYEWNYQKQLLRLQADENAGLNWDEVESHIFSRDFLLERPLLRAISSPRRVVLLIDGELSGRHPLAAVQRQAAAAIAVEQFPARDVPAVKPFALVEALGEALVEHRTLPRPSGRTDT